MRKRRGETERERDGKRLKERQRGIEKETGRDREKQKGDKKTEREKGGREMRKKKRQRKGGGYSMINKERVMITRKNGKYFKSGGNMSEYLQLKRSGCNNVLYCA